MRMLGEGICVYEEVCLRFQDDQVSVYVCAEGGWWEGMCV